MSNLCPIKKSFYGNFTCVDENNNALFRCDEKKKNWYLTRNLIEIDKNNPLIFKFLFEPRGQGHFGDPFFLQDRKNQCVVCGEKEKLTRHHVVPHCYRRFYPKTYNRFGSYDVLMLCTHDHSSYENFSHQLKLKLADEFDAPVSGIFKNQKEIADQKLFRKINSLAFALKNHGDKIPLEKKELILDKLKATINRDVITDADLDYILSKKFATVKPEVITHGEIVMSKIADLNEFNIQWRKHFFTLMQPNFLPNYWEIERKFEI